MVLKDRINIFVDNFYNVWYHYKREAKIDNDIIIKGVNNIITIKGNKVFYNDNNINFKYVREQLNKVIKGMELNKDIDYIPNLKLESILGRFKFYPDWSVEILDIIPFKEYHKVVFRTDYIDNHGDRQIEVNQSLVKYNTKHKNGYFLYLGELISLDNTKKAYGNYHIHWNVSWNFIKGLLDR